MKTFLLSFLLFLLFTSGSAQIDGYLSETGTNSSMVNKLNKINKEVVYNYSFCDEIKDITIFTDFSKIILVDLVTIYFDENGNMVTRERENKKSGTRLVDSFYYDSSYRLSEISSTSILNNQETNVGHTIYKYGDNGKVASVNTAYRLSNGMMKNSETKNVYNKKNQLVEVWKQSNLTKLMLAELYYYDRRGRVKKIDYFNDDYSAVYHYHRRRTKIVSDNDRDDYHKATIYYNGRHKCRKYIFGDKTDQFYYNSDGTLSESKSHYNGNMVSITQHHYYKD